MTITTVTYRHLISHRPTFGNTAIELTATVEPGQTYEDALAVIRAEVHRQLGMAAEVETLETQKARLETHVEVLESKVASLQSRVESLRNLRDAIRQELDGGQKPLLSSEPPF